MAGLLRSAKAWPYSVAVLTVILASLCAYAYYRHSQIKTLIEDLKSGKHEVAQPAAESLGQMGSDIVSYLMPTIKEMNSQSRFYTAHALRNIDSAVPSLVEALSDKDAAMRAAAAEILGNMGSVARNSVPDLIVVLRNDEDASVRETVKVALGEIKDPRAIPPLIETFKQASERSAAAPNNVAEESLAKIGTDAIPALKAALKNEPPRVKEACARTLGKMGTDAEGAVEALIEALKDEDINVCRTATSALGEIKAERAIEPLIKTFYRDQTVDNPAPAALGKIGSKAVEPLVVKLKTGQEGVRRFSAVALGKIGPEARAAVQPLIASLKEPGVRREALRALGRIKSEEAIPPLMKLLKENPPPEGVIEALGEIGPAAKGAVPFLSVMFWDDRLHDEVTVAWKKISRDSEAAVNEIIYLDQRYEYLENAVSVELIGATTEEILYDDDGLPTTYLVKFQWTLAEPKNGVNFCAKLLIDKGNDPFDGGKLGWPSPVIHAISPLEVQLNYGEYHDAPPFQWGVEVKACYDSGITCDKRGSCVGRTFRSRIGRYQIVD